VFHTQSDTEVVLRMLERHGVQGISRLEGMFCFAAWDARDRELMLARDWLGQKSLFWVETPQGFAFASEIKALLTLPGVKRELDLTALSHYMSLRCLPGDDTLFAGIRKLPAAHVMKVSARGRSLQQLWRPSYEPKLALRESQVIDRLDELLSTVVRQHLMSEVPLGAFLSGGIDSSLVTWYASRGLQDPLTTFAVGVTNDSQSELPWARQVAERCGTHHVETLVQPDLAMLAPRMTAALEEPVDPFGAAVYVVSEVARRHVTVALGGDGGDELFAGYDRYRGQQLAELYAHVPAVLRHRLLRPLLQRIPDSFGYQSIAAKLRWVDRAADSQGFERYADSLAYLRFPHEMKADLFTADVWPRVEQAASELLLRRYFDDGSARDFLDKVLHVDCQTRLTENQLPMIDRMSMAHSLELRSPLLDRRVAEFAMRIPAGMKMRGGRIKHVTRSLAARYLPERIVNRPKQGFGFPIARWLRGPLRGLMQSTIADSRLVQSGLFRREAMQRLLDEHVAGQTDHNFRLWMIFNLEVFWRYYFAGEDTAAIEDWIRRGSSGNALRSASPTATPAWPTITTAPVDWPGTAVARRM
jgi:asparagine synthase (glutamine-hydrolysing)